MGAANRAPITRDCSRRKRWIPSPLAAALSRAARPRAVSVKGPTGHSGLFRKSPVIRGDSRRMDALSVSLSSRKAVAPVFRFRHR
ncbi:conserved hypothetical protein [Burkholderia multivorans CGD2M]|uniref:Uncharacterized protein n=1 Tax=Burkholderia multivorans CGD2 TaxID=513052 RepID=B9BIE9_9BURK|nr:conserved hypothetical protein [Burkholderia multivorans CGD2]EEE15403.1 conserved hypothetical protein [Burkholderia multivorans CGD2M]